MNGRGERIALALVSHTNVGKTTLARTLLGRDVGTVRDAPHVTESAERFVLAESEAGDQLELWDTPGFGDSLRLARRLEQRGNLLGWFLAEVWDRFRDRPFWSTQQAVRAVLENADVVLYLVNAAEQPQDAAYVAPELKVLELIGKPALVLLNQLGPPQPEQEAAALAAWQRQLAQYRQVRGVLPLDAFARCWVQEFALLDAVNEALPAGRREAFARLDAAWRAQRQQTFDASMRELARRLARAAADRERVAEAGLRGRLREFGRALGLPGATEETPRQAAMATLAARLDADLRESTERLIELHGLGGKARQEILARLAEHFTVSERLSESKAALLGGAVTGALAGLKADIASGGLTLGGGLLVGGVLGALGAAGLARGVNLLRGTEFTEVAWTHEVLDDLTEAALLAYLAVAHHGRGRGDWAPAAAPEHWRQAVAEAIKQTSAARQALWNERSVAVPADLQPTLERELTAATRLVLQKLYPRATFANALPTPRD